MPLILKQLVPKSDTQRRFFVSLRNKSFLTFSSKRHWIVWASSTTLWLLEFEPWHVLVAALLSAGGAAFIALMLHLARTG